MIVRRAGLLLLLLAVLAAACASADDGGETDGMVDEMVDQPDVVETAAAASVAFCDGANAFVTSTETRFITTPDADVFQNIDTQLEAMVGQAPQAIVDDVEVLRVGFAAIGDAYASTGYEPTASFVLPIDVQQANLEAGRNLEDHLLRACDLERERDDQIQQISEAFGIEDAATAECLHTQMGDIANIDPSALTPELMTTSVCGTSILGLLSGESIDG